jgi:hypothetical protein
MAMYAIKIGMPREHVFTETHAEHSTENVYYSYHKAKQMGFRKMALASDPFQTRMLRRFVRTKVNKDIKLLPFVTEIMMSMHPYPPEPRIDHMSVFKKDFVPMPERVSVIERWRGTLGYNLDKNLYP